MAKYGPTSKAINNPVRVYLKDIRRWVAIGGKITIERKAPKKSEVIPEATATQYKDLYERRKLTHLITNDFKTTNKES